MRIYISILIVLFLSVCRPQEKTTDRLKPLGYTEMKYSQAFGIAHYAQYSQLFYLDQSDTLWSVKSTELKSQGRIAVLSSVFAGFIEALHQQHAIVAVDKGHYYNDSLLLALIQTGKIAEMGEEGQLHIEKILQIQPDLLIGSSFLQSQTALMKRLERAQIKLLSCDNFKEQNPLARAEWIKFFGFILQEEEQAKTYFDEVEARYLDLKNKVHRQNKPLVLTDALYRDVWNVPGSKSYTAQLIADAGARYLFQEKSELYTYPLNLETVLQSAQKAEYWIHVNQFKNRDEMLQADRRYALIAAFKAGEVWNNNKKENAFGGNDFWETGVVRPDWVLSDLIQIFSGTKNSEDKLYFYTHLD